MNFQEKFDELKAKYGKVDESKLSEPFAIQVNMTEDESAGTFYVAYVNNEFSVEPYDYRDHTAMITVPVKDLEDVLSRKADAVNLFLTGKLAVEGNIDHALALVNLMAKEEKKTTRKKAETAKAEDGEKAKKPAKKTCAKEKAPDAVCEEKTDASAEKAADKKTAAKAPAKKTAKKSAK